MDGDELAAIRAKRMAEMKASQGGGAGGMSGMGLPGGLSLGGAGGSGGPSQQEQAEKQSQMEEMRRAMMAQILSPEARERLARIRIVKEEKARGVEEMLIRMAQSGQIRGKVSESQLIEILGQVNETVSTSTKIKFTRRAAADDSDEELLAGL